MLPLYGHRHRNLEGMRQFKIKSPATAWQKSLSTAISQGIACTFVSPATKAIHANKMLRALGDVHVEFFGSGNTSAIFVRHTWRHSPRDSPLESQKSLYAKSCSTTRINVDSGGLTRSTSRINAFHFWHTTHGVMRHFTAIGKHFCQLLFYSTIKLADCAKLTSVHVAVPELVW